MAIVTNSGSGPALLRLQKWGPAHRFPDLSEYHDAFISPSRKLLLLLSHQSEALLLPLDYGELFSSSLVGTDVSATLQSADSQRSNFLDGNASTSQPSIPFLNEPSFLTCAKSVAWAHFGDAYNQQKDCLFNEFLLVSGISGVTVHCFRRLDDKTGETKPTLEGIGVKGKWVDWGPDTSMSDTGQAAWLNESVENGGSPSRRHPTSKKWLRTFLTEVETVSTNDFFTKFPAKSSFPDTAHVVSFNLLFASSVFLNFLERYNPVLDEKENCSHTESELKSQDLKVSSDETLGMAFPLKCARVFSSSSNRLCGFVLEVAGPLPMDAGENNEQCVGRILVVIGVLYLWGMQWLCSIPLWSLGPKREWTDFRFSDNLLVCLDSGGLIAFWDATKGGFLVQINILELCGLNASPKTIYEQQSVMSKTANCGSNIVNCDQNKRKFKRLMIVSSSLLLGVVDDLGVVYVICAYDYVSENCYSANKLTPHFLHCGLGTLAGWEAAGSDIGGQTVLSDVSNYKGFVKNNSLSCTFHGDEFRLWKKHKRLVQGQKDQQGSLLSTSSNVSQGTGCNVSTVRISSASQRRIFLPFGTFNEEDTICFSALGVTRLVNGCTLNGQRGFRVVHSCLHIESVIHDDRGLDTCLQSGGSCLLEDHQVYNGKALGCSFQGCLYLVCADGLFVVLPTISVSANVGQVESFGNWPSGVGVHTENLIKQSFTIKEPKRLYRPWQREVLDRVLLHEGPKEADYLCIANGWDLKIPRIRRLLLAIHYMKFGEIEQSLEMLADVGLAEEAVLKLLFAAAHHMFGKVGTDSGGAVASRLLALATCFATKMVRKYGLQEAQDKMMCQAVGSPKILYLESALSRKNLEIGNTVRLKEMAHFLEIIRNLQRHLTMKSRLPQGVVDDNKKGLVLADPNVPPQASSISAHSVNSTPDASEAHSEKALDSTSSYLALVNKEKLDLSIVEPMLVSSSLGSRNSGVIVVSKGERGLTKKILPLENPSDMIKRWKFGNLDLKTVVSDALQSDRLPLAVLQLHLQRSKDSATSKDSHDSFSEVRDVGRAIAYDLFLKGETALAVATLQRLGEDIEVSLMQLVFGSVTRSLRLQIAEEMKKWGYLRSQELETLDKISLIERLYPSSTFWSTYISRQKQTSKDSSGPALLERNRLQFACDGVCNSLVIECGEIDGVVLGSWTSLDESHRAIEEDNNIDAGYWSGAAIWSDAWDQKTIDRIVLDQPFHMGVHVQWESQLEYYLCHSNWEEALKLLQMIPGTMLSDGSLQINLVQLSSLTAVGPLRKFPDAEYCRTGELESVCINVPNIKLFTFSASKICCSWSGMLLEQELAKKFIFIKDYWEGTEEIVPLLARAGFLTGTYDMGDHSKYAESFRDLDFSNMSQELNKDTMHALHRVVVHHCSRHNLPNLLDVYLDHHEVVIDDQSVDSLLEAAGECHWAKWLLLSRVKGQEYDASFSNARSIMSRSIVPANSLSIPVIDDIVCTVDDIAEGGGELAALATLIYAPIPIQKCLCSGIVKRHSRSSAQCTLENLRPCLEDFPTLWHTLVAACFGPDLSERSSAFRAKNVFGKSTLSVYLTWRENIFSSSGGDTSLVQMIPSWFSKSIKRLIHIFVQGPLGWQSVTGGINSGESFVPRDIYLDFACDENTEAAAVSWEAAIEKNIRKELLASSTEVTGFGAEHFLHRGRALAAFTHVLTARSQKLKIAYSRQSPHGAPIQAQANIQVDIQALLAPLTPAEESHLSSVMPLAILHFEDSVLVASCAFLLELCGLSANMLRIDVASLNIISSYYKSIEYKELHDLSAPKSSVHSQHDGDITISLARALADDYLRQDNLQNLGGKDTPPIAEVGRRPSQALHAVLVHLEKASLPSVAEGVSSGSWLFNGSGDGAELRLQQKAASEQWSLVTAFCQIHQLPPSTKYLSILARDNDWVGFLTEAQHAGLSFDAIVRVASEDFNDPRLKIHILNVLRSMQSARRKVGAGSNLPSMASSDTSLIRGDYIFAPVELFGLLAECEKQTNPGEALLVRAKDLRWPLLAMVASCFPDTSPLACLIVWLEITASRETSSIKVNDVFSRISKNAGAAVEKTNALPANSRSPPFHYNRRNPKRRRLGEPTKNALSTVPFELSTSGFLEISAVQEVTNVETKNKGGVQIRMINDPVETLASLSEMVVVLCEQHLFLPLLRAFEMFLPSCCLLPFIRFLQAFSQMRLTDAANHLNHFCGIVRDEHSQPQSNLSRDSQIGRAWISSTAVEAANAVLSSCPSPYEKRCLLHLLSSSDFGDSGSATAHFRRLYWKINIAEPCLRKDDGLCLGTESLDDDASLLAALEKNGDWDQARSWARQLEASGGQWLNVVHHVTEKQAEALVTEWKEFLWDVPEERAALWGHCQTLFIRHHFPSLEAGLFFLRHAEALEKDIPPKELHEMLLLSLQWLSGTINQVNPVYPLHLLREIETRVWLLAVESEAQAKTGGDFTALVPTQQMGVSSPSIIEQTATVVAEMDNHLSVMSARPLDKNDPKETNGADLHHPQVLEANLSPTTGTSSTKAKRRAKGYQTLKRPVTNIEKKSEQDNLCNSVGIENNKLLGIHEEHAKVETSVSGWEERVGPAELERAVLSLLEFGQVTAAKQLHHKLSPSHVPTEFDLLDAAFKLASVLCPSSSVEVSLSSPDVDVISAIESHGILSDHDMTHPLQVLEAIALKCTEGSGRGLCKRIIAVVKAANMLGLSFSEAFEKKPIELLQLLSLKAQESFEEAKLLVQTHFMPPASIAQILAESFLKGLLAAHRGGYMDSQKEEGPAPLLWRFSDFLKWAELCPSEPEIGHALMRLVITGQEIPHACEVELLILSHHFYKSSACLDGVDVLVALAATRVESYVSEGDFSCLARLVTGVSNFHALNFILGILIENGQLELLLHKCSAAEIATGTADEVRGFRMAVLAALKHFNPQDLDALAMVYNHFDMKHETASLLELRARQSIQHWLYRYYKDQSEDLLDAMLYFIEAAEVHSSIDAGNKTHRACAQASLLSLQIRIPDFDWLNLSETNARRALVEQYRFQEALIVAEAYALNQPSEWALVLWNQMLKPELLEEFLAQFVTALPLQPSMLAEVARFYRLEVAARGDQFHFSVWLSPGGLPVEWVRHLAKSFRSLLKRTRDLRLRLQLATIATGFGEVVDACSKALDRVPDTTAPLVLRKGHGGAYLPLM